MGTAGPNSKLHYGSRMNGILNVAHSSRVSAPQLSMTSNLVSAQFVTTTLRWHGLSELIKRWLALLLTGNQALRTQILYLHL